MMKDLILNNWAAKLLSLLLAIILWFLIKKNIETMPAHTETARAVAAGETPRKQESSAKSDKPEKSTKQDNHPVTQGPPDKTDSHHAPKPRRTPDN